MSFKVKFWGVRGSIACPSPNHVVYGGNTSCVELTIKGRTIILDAGTGIRSLGHKFIKRADTRPAYMLLTHTHWDHINGFPFFAPIFNPAYTFTIMAGHLGDNGCIKDVLSTQMAQPMFPVPLGALQANLTFHDFKAGDSFTVFDDVAIHTTPLRHPNNATGYRIESDGVVVCYVTDTEHTPGKPDENVLDLIRGANLVIYDATYTDEEYPKRVGWGHSTWEEGVRLCRAAGVKKLAIFHHDPEHDDEFMEQLEDKAQREWSGAVVARDNMEITLA
jgi:phosphoribosyl 1,2-cyclic phosphodiesterase